MPDWTEHLRARLSTLRLNPGREAEIIEELSQHLEERYAELRAGGMTEIEARRLAIDELREPEALADYMQPLRQAHVPLPITPGASRGSIVSDVLQDVRYAARTLRKRPGFAVAAIVTLALGIGANTAIFSLVNATLLQTLPVANRDRLVYVHRGNIGGSFPYPYYVALRDESRSLEQMIAWGAIVVSLNADNETDQVQGAIVSGNFFPVLGIRPHLGRLLTHLDDARPGAHPVAVVGYEFWQTRFGGRTDIVGHDIRLNGHVFTIVGVAPQGFTGPQLGSVRNIYVPLMMQAIVRPPRAAYSGERNPDLLRNRTNSWLSAIGLLKPGLTADQARSDLESVATVWARSTEPHAPRQRVSLVPVDEGDPRQREQMRSAAWLLGGVVGAVLLIACANIANLLLARAASRRREFAVRLAVGANRGRLVRQLLTESVLVATMGGAAGVALAWAVVQAFEGAPPPPGAFPLAIDFSLDLRVLIFALALSVVTGIMFGVAPALRASRPSLVPSLKDAVADSSDGRHRFTLQKALVVSEVALSLLLLVAAGLFVRSLYAARAIDPGFDAPKLVSAPLSVNLLRYTTAQGREFYRRVVERVEQIPGVEAATVSRVPLMTGGGRVLSFRVEGRDAPDNQWMSEGGSVAAADRFEVNANVVGPRYFKTFGIPFVTGRDFDARDSESAPPVIIVNEALARKHFARENPLGKRVSFAGTRGPWREIVGVVRDSKYATLGEEPLAIAYMPVAQNHETGMILYVRTSVPPETIVASMRREIQALEPNLPVPDIRTMNETIGAALYAARMGAWLLAVFGGLALLLAAVGVYGVLSFAISRRTREMGIRLALGANTRDVFLLVVRDGMLLVGAGLLLGLAGGIVGARSLASFLYGISPSDPATYAVMITILVAIAFIACAIPARRAMRVPPITALRYE